MCGFVGLLSRGDAPSTEQLASMSQSIQHRGPDDEGFYVDEAGGVAMAHRRLSILDLSEHGHQPMHSASGRYVLVYNGEIYNHPELRMELERTGQAPEFRGNSDTETLLALIESRGIESTLKCLNGMFAIAVWDRQERRLLLARDRMGEKPLYVGWLNNCMVFASELKPLLSHYSFELEPQSVGRFLSFGYIPAPWSILKGVFKLPPGCFQWYSIDDAMQKRDINGFVADVKRYWSLEETALAGRRQPFTGSMNDALDQLDGLLGDAVEKRMLSDVSLGVCLSGGIDSSLVAALMRSHTNGKVKTFSIGFREDAFNEAHHARAAARHLGCEHTEAILEPGAALDLIPEMASVYDEPFADVSQLPTYLLSRLLKEHVKVALSGDGADELFLGYTRYFVAPRLWHGYGRLPRRLRRPAASMLIRGWMRNYRFWNLGQRLSAPDFEGFFGAFVSLCPNAGVLYHGADPVWNYQDVVPGSLKGQDARMMYLDQMGYLPDDILAKVDRASMAVSLEMRTPFMDHGLVEWAWSLPDDYKREKGRGKWLLRMLLERYLPKQLFDRPKQGFGVPIGVWLRGPLKPWAEELLSEPNMQRCPRLKREAVFELWQYHQRGQFDAGHTLWALLTLLAWLKYWKP
ncbi:asparagine synthase (glutamine-hydrolyzing) [Thiolapillus brandeum]|uniref:asparagine synthase (glutamine-hydrolyzing) n=1 Tax=Thiolapillus brandeum TaxID=1076588 RepID=A0A7U6JHT1_9GAMM|nr:asparagine synthase (glutamine-hydrolyzing) [Thiolapillus brandeum]BAO43525.1 asparagine synthase, glutamine-hydrolyzing [Thiolapillus brandeum]